jgi:hypothetical protein
MCSGSGGVGARSVLGLGCAGGSSGVALELGLRWGWSGSGSAGV